MEKKKIILDCDPGMDDSMAIVMACKSEALDVLAVTTLNGNYPAEVTCVNALKVLEMIGRTDIPVGKGMEVPMVRSAPKESFSHGADGQAENFLPEPKTPRSPKHAVDRSIDLVKANPGEVTILSTDPMSNIAMALRKEPQNRAHDPGNHRNFRYVWPEQICICKLHRRYAPKRVECLCGPGGRKDRL